MATVKLNEFMKRFELISTLHPNINSFGCGQLDDLQQDTRYYPYIWMITDLPHILNYSTDNGYRSVVLSFTMRIGDKKNLQTGHTNISGIGSDNQLDILSNTFQILLDIINTISEDSLSIFSDVKLVDDISIQPFYNEDDGDVCGNEAVLVFKIKNDKTCINPLTE